MKNLFNYKWLIAINTLPVCVLFFLFYREYSVIHTLLERENIYCWLMFGGSLASLAIVNLLYALYLRHKKEGVSGYYAVFCLIAYIAWAYAYIWSINYIYPFDTPKWMFTGEIILYAGAFLMPTLAYAVLLLVALCTKHPETRSAWIDFLIAVLIPVVFYALFMGLIPIWNLSLGIFRAHIYLFLFIVCTLALLFFLCRGVYIIVAKKSAFWMKIRWVWMPLVTLVMPIAGLWLNNAIFSGDLLLKDGGGAFGNFSNTWFYILAVLNGIVLCMPQLSKKGYRYMLYLLRCATYTYTLYFFLVFLPFLPFSLIAIIAVGLGFLMLAPLLLFLIHTRQLYVDFCYLKQSQSPVRLIALGVLGALIIPTFITCAFVRDRKTLHTALAYAYEADRPQNNRLDKETIANVLHIIKERNEGGNMLMFSSYYIPYISSFYTWVVLDNLTLSESKVNTLEYLYLGKAPRLRGNGMAKDEQQIYGSHLVTITDLKGASRYDEASRSWISTVDIELTNASDWGGYEYATQFLLPDGCWISNYHLYVGDKKEEGLLVEKKAAIWTYTQIINDMKDPGILYYDTGNKIVFKVFPFDKREVRKTSIEFIHKEPFVLQLDEHTLALGSKSEANDVAENKVVEIIDGNALYIPSLAKETLEVVRRRPYFHFIADASMRTTDSRERFITVADNLMAAYPLLAEDARFTLADTYIQTYASHEPWKENFLNYPAEGGFFLDRAIKTALTAANGSDAYPVIVVLTDDVRFSVMDKNYADFRFLYPETEYIYVPDSTGAIYAHSLLYNTYYPAADSLALFPPVADVRMYTDEKGRKSYLRNDTISEIVIKEEIPSVIFHKGTATSWERGLEMQAYWLSLKLYPETSQKGWLHLVRKSFSTGIMSPLTSYMVVENEAQKAALKRKQKQVMSGNQSLDAGEDDMDRMSEPEFYILLLLLLPLLWGIRRKRARLRRNV